MKHLKIFEEFSEEDLLAMEHGKRTEQEWQEWDQRNEEEPQEEIQEEEPQEVPDMDDFVISSNGWKFSVGSEDHGFIGDFVEWDDAVAALKEWMEKHKWYPNVWTMSDHGNLNGPFSVDDL